MRVLLWALAFIILGAVGEYTLGAMYHAPTIPIP